MLALVPIPLYAYWSNLYYGGMESSGNGYGYSLKMVTFAVQPPTLTVPLPGLLISERAATLTLIPVLSTVEANYHPDTKNDIPSPTLTSCLRCSLRQSLGMDAISATPTDTGGRLQDPTSTQSFGPQASLYTTPKHLFTFFFSKGISVQQNLVLQNKVNHNNHL